MRNREQRLLGQVERVDSYEEVLIESGGVPVALSIWEGAPNRGAMVFLPGTMTHPLFYEDFLDAVNRNGFTVVGVHFQGHGKSPRVERVLRWDDLVHNALDAVEYTVDRFSCPVVLAGSSQGAFVAVAATGEGAPVAGVLAHNVFDPELAESVQITRVPKWLWPLHPMLDRMMLGIARLAPRLRVPPEAYLEPARVFGRAWTRELFEQDPLTLASYPLRFLADLITADLSCLQDGRLQVPVVVIAARGDRLFPLDYVRRVFDRVVAPRKDLVVVDADCHLVFNEALDTVLPIVLHELEGMLPAGQDDV